MSMWLNLARVTPTGLTAIRAEPTLLDTVFFESASPSAGLVAGYEVTGYQFEIVMEMAEEYGAESFWDQDTWLTKAVGIGADNLEYRFNYGPAWFMAPDRVVEVGSGLLADADRAASDYADLIRSFADFYASAASRGMGLVGGVS